MPIQYSHPLFGGLGASDALMQGLPCLSFMLLLLAYYCTHYAISDRRYLNLLASRFFGLLWGLLYVNAEAGIRQTSRCIHSRSNHHAYILRYWYLVPLIKPPWAAGLLHVF